MKGPLWLERALFHFARFHVPFLFGIIQKINGLRILFDWTCSQRSMQQDNE